MADQKTVNGVLVNLTPEEQQALDEERNRPPEVETLVQLWLSDFYGKALKRAERDNIDATTDPDAKDMNRILRTYTYVTVGTDMTNEDRQRTENVLDAWLAANMLAPNTPARKAEILNWRVGMPTADEAQGGS